MIVYDLFLLAVPGEARGRSTNTSITHCLIYSFSDPLLPTALRCCRAQTIKESSSSYAYAYLLLNKPAAPAAGQTIPDATPPLRKIHPFSKSALTFKPI